jgi:hypothetical protein
MKKTLLLVLALMLVISLAACGGNTDNPSGNGGNNSTNPPASNGGSNPSGIIDIPHEDISLSDISDDKAAVIAEIPAELLKGVGESNFSMISTTGVLPGYKYTLLINLDTEDGKADAELEKLMDYYRSIGGTVTESKELLNDYDVKFDYAESISCSALSSSIQLQVSIVKGAISGEKDENLILPEGQAWVQEGNSISGYIFKADGTFSYHWGDKFTVSSEGTWFTSGGKLTMSNSSAQTYTVSGDTLTLKSALGGEDVYTKKPIPSGN